MIPYLLMAALAVYDVVLIVTLFFAPADARVPVLTPTWERIRSLFEPRRGHWPRHHNGEFRRATIAREPEALVYLALAFGFALWLVLIAVAS